MSPTQAQIEAARLAIVKYFTEQGHTFADSESACWGPSTLYPQQIAEAALTAAEGSAMKPTQTQIEAAAKAIYAASEKHPRYATIQMNVNLAEDYATAALTAAAEVGEPSDSKVATVAKAIKEAHECYGNEYATMACAAIEAGAAGMGRRLPQMAAQRNVQLQTQAETNATIKRCAQVAVEARARFEPTVGSNMLDDLLDSIVAAICALKDKP